MQRAFGAVEIKYVMKESLIDDSGNVHCPPQIEMSAEMSHGHKSYRRTSDVLYDDLTDDD